MAGTLAGVDSSKMDSGLLEDILLREWMSEQYHRGTWPFSLVLSILMLVGALGNALVIAITPCHGRNTAQTCIIFMAAIDFVISAVVMPYDLYQARYYTSFTSEASCKVLEWLKLWMLGQSSSTLVVIALERFYAITQHRRSSCVHWLSRRNKAIMLCLLFLSALVSSPALHYIGVEASQLAPYLSRQYPEMSHLAESGRLRNDTTTYTCKYLTVHYHSIGVYLFSLALFLWFLAVVVLTLVFYAKIYWYVKEVQDRLRSYHRDGKIFSSGEDISKHGLPPLTADTSSGCPSNGAMTSGARVATSCSTTAKGVLHSVELESLGHTFSDVFQDASSRNTGSDPDDGRNHCKAFESRARYKGNHTFKKNKVAAADASGRENQRGVVVSAGRISEVTKTVPEVCDKRRPQGAVGQKTSRREPAKSTSIALKKDSVDQTKEDLNAKTTDSCPESLKTVSESETTPGLCTAETNPSREHLQVNVASASTSYPPSPTSTSNWDFTSSTRQATASVKHNTVVTKTGELGNGNHTDYSTSHDDSSRVSQTSQLQGNYSELRVRFIDRDPGSASGRGEITPTPLRQDPVSVQSPSASGIYTIADKLQENVHLHHEASISRLSRFQSLRIQTETSLTPVEKVSISTVFGASRLTARPAQVTSERRTIFGQEGQGWTTRMDQPKQAPSGLSREQRRKLRATRILLIVTGASMLSWVPLWVLDVCYLVWPDLERGRDWGMISLIALVWHSYFLSPALNPVLYLICSAEFRRKSLALLAKMADVFRGRGR